MVFSVATSNNPPVSSLPSQRTNKPVQKTVQTATEDEASSRPRKFTALAQKESPVAKSWAHFVAGGIGGMTAATLTSPLDVLKTRLQSDFYQSQLAETRRAKNIPHPSTLPPLRSAALHVRETFQILFSIHRVEGWRALFKGLGPNLTGVVPARSINFFTYGNGKKILSSQFNNGEENVWVQLCAAVTAGLMTGTATNPIWLIKTRLQLDKSTAEKSGGLATRRYRNSWDCVKQVVKQEGIQGLYRGLSASYLGVSESTLQWVLYEQIKSRLAQRQENLNASGRERTYWDHTVELAGVPTAAGGAKLFAASVTYPHEVVRTRLRQAPSTTDGRLKYTGLKQCFKLVWMEEGMLGLYGGLTPHLMRVVPSAVIMFGMYETILKLLGAES